MNASGQDERADALRKQCVEIAAGYAAYIYDVRLKSLSAFLDDIMTCGDCRHVRTERYQQLVTYQQRLVPQEAGFLVNADIRADREANKCWQDFRQSYAVYREYDLRDPGLCGRHRDSGTEIRVEMERCQGVRSEIVMLRQRFESIKEQGLAYLQQGRIDAAECFCEEMEKEIKAEIDTMLFWDLLRTS